MPGTALNNDVTKISAGREVQIWAGLSIPPAGAILTLDPTTGTPDSTANSNARHLGFTDKGVTLTAKGSWQEFYADELAGAIKTVFDASEMRIQAGLMQVEDKDIMALLTSGFGTLNAITGGSKLSFGIGAQAYSSIAAIWKLEADPSKYCIFHMYKAVNKGGLDGFNKSRKEKSVVNADFMGYDVPGRAQTDTLGYYYIPTVS